MSTNSKILSCLVIAVLIVQLLTPAAVYTHLTIVSFSILVLIISVVLGLLWSIFDYLKEH